METKLKFKVGDKVRVKSLEWYNSAKDDDGDIMIGWIFTEDMSNFCEEILTIEAVCGDYYKVEGNDKNWEDWMFEDEVVTEEKQQLKNEKEMETKEMTQEEIFEYLNNTKILCTSDEETKNVQEKLFELGIKWKIAGVKINEKVYLLHINYNYLMFNSDIRSWMNSHDKRIEPNEILAIQIKEEEKPKFDPKGLKPFDKVLVRDKEGDKWRCNLFCHIDDELKHKYFCVFDNWIYCIPFNDETKHLVGTKDDAPEFYRI